MKRSFTRFLILLVLFNCWINVALTQDKGVNEAPDASTWMPDANLRTAVRSALDVTNDADLTQEAMTTLTELLAGNASISNIAGLEHATNLTKLDLRSNNISGISPLSGLTNLTDLWLAFNQITDIGRTSQFDKPEAIDDQGQSNRRCRKPEQPDEPNDLVGKELWYHRCFTATESYESIDVKDCWEFAYERTSAFESFKSEQCRYYYSGSTGSGPACG